jgi:hypothetical protein
VDEFGYLPVEYHAKMSKKNENKGNHPLWASFVESHLRISLFTVNQFCFKFLFKYFYLIFYIIIKGILNMRKDFCQIFKLNYLYNFMILHRSTVIYSFSFFLFFFKYLDCFRINFLVMRLVIFFFSSN